MYVYSCFPTFVMHPFDTSNASDSSTSFSRIAFANIHGIYWRGRYGESEVIIRSTDSFTNASKLCALYAKDFVDWQKEHQNLIDYIEIEMRDEHFLYQPYSPRSEFKAIDYVFPLAPYDYEGIYIHPYLLPHLMIWLKKQFALFASKALNQYLCNSYMDSFDMLRRNASTKVDVETHTPHTKQRRVDVVQQKTTHCIAILQLNDDAAEFPYYMIRCKGRALKPSIRKIQKRHCAACLIYVQKHVSNTKNLFDALKQTETFKNKLNYFTFEGKDGLISKIRSLSEPITSTEAVDCDNAYILDVVKQY